MVGPYLIVAVSALAWLADEPRPASVAVDRLEVFDEPDDAGFVTETLARGDRVLVRRPGPEGWAAIVPPPEAFSLIDEADIEEIDDDRARVVARLAAVRPGREGSRFPGPSRLSVRKGTIVRLVDRRPVVVRQQGEVRTWKAIKPPRDEVRYVRADSIADGPVAEHRDDDAPRRGDPKDLEPLEPEPNRPRVKPAAIRVGPIDARFAEIHPAGAEPKFSPEFAAELARVEAIHRLILRYPLDRWDLAPARSAYRALLDRQTGAAEKAAIQSRLERLDRQDSAAQATRTMGSLLKKSRERDQEIADLRRRVAESSRPDDLQYVAKGLFQGTTHVIEGRKVYALINGDGGVAAYVLVPPGMAAGPLLSRQVGVTGDSRYNETLRGRVISARDLDALGPVP